MSCHDVENPNLQLFFKGLFAFCFSQKIVQEPVEKADECQVGVLGVAPGHQLKITVIKDDGVAPEISSLSIDPNLGGKHKFITLNTANDPQGVCCVKQAEPPKRDIEFPPPGRNDIRWIVDFEGKEFYDSKLTLLKSVFLPIIKIKAGLFYTHRVTKAPFVKLQGNKIKVANFGRVAEVVGADIKLPADSEFVLNLGLIPVVKEKITDKLKYRITFENSCPQFKRREGDRPVVALRTYQENNLTFVELEAFDIDLKLFDRDAKAEESSAAAAPLLAIGDQDVEEVLAQLPSDIQYFHYGFDKRPNEWFDLRVPSNSRGVRPAICYASLLGQNLSLPDA